MNHGWQSESTDGPKGGWSCFPKCGLSCVRQTLPNRPQPSATVRNRPQPSATVRNRPQPFATVRNRLHEVALAVPKGSSAKGLSFGAFPRGIASCRVAGVALCDIPTCFTTRQKVVLCGSRNTVATFSKDVLHFSWQAQHFGHLRCHFPWQAQRFRRVVLRFFLANRIVSAARSGDRCKFRGRRGIL